MQYFMFEYLHTSNPILANLDTDYWPRLHRWGRIERASKSVGAQRFNHPSSRQQFEMRSPDSICWRPYKDSRWNMKENIIIAYQMSMHRVLFLDPQLGATWYLGDRCYRQLTGSIVIPRNPPTPMSRISRDVYFNHLETNWHPASDYVTVATQEEFDAYWKKSSRGAIIPPLTRYANTDGVGYASVCAPHVRLPEPPLPSYRPGVYATQTQGSSSQSIHRFEWSAEIAAPGGASMTVNVTKPTRTSCPPTSAQTIDEWRDLYIDARDYARALQSMLLRETQIREDAIAEKEAEIERLQATMHSSPNVYRPTPSHFQPYNVQHFSENTSQPDISLAMDDDQFNGIWNMRG